MMSGLKNFIGLAAGFVMTGCGCNPFYAYDYYDLPFIHPGHYVGVVDGETVEYIVGEEGSRGRQDCYQPIVSDTEDYKIPIKMRIIDNYCNGKVDYLEICHIRMDRDELRKKGKEDELNQLLEKARSIIPPEYIKDRRHKRFN